jgi:hypothetical protein
MLDCIKQIQQHKILLKQIIYFDLDLKRFYLHVIDVSISCFGINLLRIFYLLDPFISLEQCFKVMKHLGPML